MNCKPGDMALVVRGWGPNVGKVVTCIRICKPTLPLHGKDVWKIDRTLVWHSDSGVLVELPYALDAYLLPLRPNQGEPSYTLHEVGEPA